MPQLVQLKAGNWLATRQHAIGGPKNVLSTITTGFRSPREIDRIAFPAPSMSTSAFVGLAGVSSNAALTCLPPIFCPQIGNNVIHWLSPLQKKPIRYRILAECV